MVKTIIFIAVIVGCILGGLFIAEHFGALFPSLDNRVSKILAEEPPEVDLWKFDLYREYKVKGEFNVDKDTYKSSYNVSFPLVDKTTGVELLVHVEFYDVVLWDRFLMAFKDTGSGTVKITGKGQNRKRQMIRGGPEVWPISRLVSQRVVNVGDDKAVKGAPSVTKIEEFLEVWVMDPNLFVPTKQTNVKVEGAKVHPGTIDLKAKTVSGEVR